MTPPSQTQQSYLRMIAVERWPGYVAATRHSVLVALERRGYLASRPDPTAPGKSLWTATKRGAAYARWLAKNDALYADQLEQAA